MRILGISAFYHDSAAALVEDGRIVAAAQEERFTRKKHDATFPRNAVGYCLDAASAKLSEIEYIAFYDKPFLKFERLLETYIAMAPKGFSSFKMAIPLWLKEKLFQKSLLRKQLKPFDGEISSDKLLFTEHHLSHAASAFFPSPFEKAVVLTMDGVGEWATTSAAIGEGNKLEIFQEIHFPHSLGLLYSALTYYTGFKVNSGEYKVMGLAPYGEPKYAKLILDHLIDLKPDGSFRLDMSYFDYCTGLTMTNERFAKLFGAPVRTPDKLLTPFHMDVAASIQAVLDEAVLRLTRSLAKKTGARNLCLAGGVALNCVANGKVLRDGRFDKIWIQPAAGDAGGAVGAALAAYHQFKGNPRTVASSDGMSGAFLGPQYSQSEIERRLKGVGARFDVLSEETVIETTAKALADQLAVGWFQGRMEFGPRSLGARSILGDPRSPTMQKNLNLKVKYRESFRPFAPAVLREDVADWFEFESDSPYMLIVADVLKDKRRAMSVDEQALFGIDKLNVSRSEIPAVTHIDYSARIQTVNRDTNPKFHRLLTEFKWLTGCPVLVNTSFNVRGEPIVCTPEDAFRCFMGSELDLLVVGNCVLKKSEQNTALRQDYSSAFELD
ncbi:carbamoyltransferase [Bradyrhizobium japonicum]|uniref:Carbamoyltransferase n=1 Tax=Bradyrhizobium diazoefficiens TaxID=1355477 RepID=A0A809YQ92_9BRAD|nr:carbamoyltransferase [Bradyrhizobium diazoefficiens]MBP1063388.1 carbamoyltransferase [Bradyrhizobium japonicum]BBZ97142.1 carbamoyltransferase [Bradyrhizobium diazoefficiens]BCA06199.1 carbamoyltransferase [Bradyrhizobium diazoefficiens]BCA14828.1 carbamoyltransferase [Bradyrhizobium diazoefficiens]BCA23551.1 carbamoyltransferase [Bradyrhizobium diazoefficiens]